MRLPPRPQLALCALLASGCSSAVDEPAPPPLPPLPAPTNSPQSELAPGRLTREGLRFPAHATVLREGPTASEIDVPVGLARVERFLLPQLVAPTIERATGKVILVGATPASAPGAAPLTVVLRADGAHTRVALRREATPTDAEVAALPPARPDPKPLLAEGAGSAVPLVADGDELRAASPSLAKVE